MDCRLGDDPWAARVSYASPRKDIERLLAGVVPEGAIPSEAWLTTFEHRNWPEAADHDLVFLPSRSDETVIPPPIIYYDYVEIPLELGIVALAGTAFWMVRRARNRRRRR